MDLDKATRLVEEASSAPSSASSPAAANDAALALAWLQGQAGGGRLRHAAAARLAQPIARLVAAEGLASGSSATRANAAALTAALAATLDPNDEDGAAALSALDAAAAAPLARAVAAAACPQPEGAAAAAPTPRALLINALSALSVLCSLGGAARRRCLGREPADDGLLLPALLAVALGAADTPEDKNKGDLPPKPDLEVREAAMDVLCAAASAGPAGADGGARRALVEAEAPAVAARVLIVAGAAAEQEEEDAVVAAAAMAAGGGQGGAGGQRQQQQQRRAPLAAAPQDTPSTELRMRCLLLLGILCGGGGGGGGGGGSGGEHGADDEAAARREALRQAAREPGAIPALMAAMRLGAADPQAAGVSRALLAGLRRDAELAPLVEAALREAVAAVAAAAARA